MTLLRDESFQMQGDDRLQYISEDLALVQAYQKTSSSIRFSGGRDLSLDLHATVDTDSKASELASELEDRGWRKQATEPHIPHSLHYRIRINGPTVRIVLFKVEGTPVATVHIIQHFLPYTNHYEYSIPNLGRLGTPSTIEVFTDVFFNDCKKLEAQGIWVSKRRNKWRLKTVRAFGELLLTLNSIENPGQISRYLEENNLAVNLDKLQSSEEILTVRVTYMHPSSTVDFIRLPNDTFYAVSKRQSQQKTDGTHAYEGTVESVAHGAQMKAPQCKLFAFREPANATSLTIDEIPLAVLFSLPLSSITRAQRTRSLLKRMFLGQRWRFYNCANPTRRLVKQILGTLQSNDDVSKLVEALGLLPDTECVGLLVRNLTVRPQRRTVKQTVTRWVRALLSGDFVERCRPQYGDRDGEDKQIIEMERSKKEVIVHMNTQNYAFSNDFDAPVPDLKNSVVLALGPSPPGTRRFYHGTRTANARSILDDKPKVGRGPPDSFLDLGQGFYMAEKFEVSVPYAIDGAQTGASGELDPCVLVLDMDMEDVNILHLQGDDWKSVVKSNLQFGNLDLIKNSKPELKNKIDDSLVLSAHIVENKEDVVEDDAEPIPVLDEHEFTFRPDTFERFNVRGTTCFVKQVQMVRWKLVR